MTAFASHSEFIQQVNKMTMDDHLIKLSEYGITPFKNPAETEYIAKYLCQAERKNGVTNRTANVVHARTSTDKLFKELPHLAHKYDEQTITVSQPTENVKPQPKAKVAKAAKVVHANGSVFFRGDRNMWVCVVDGRQPAARDTKEKVLAYMAKKFPDIKPIVVE